MPSSIFSILANIFAVAPVYYKASIRQAVSAKSQNQRRTSANLRQLLTQSV